jgi:hypothetical protein
MKFRGPQALTDSFNSGHALLGTTTVLRRDNYRKNEWPGRNAGQLRILGGRLAREA